MRVCTRARSRGCQFPRWRRICIERVCLSLVERRQTDLIKNNANCSIGRDTSRVVFVLRSGKSLFLSRALDFRGTEHVDVLSDTWTKASRRRGEERKGEHRSLHGQSRSDPDQRDFRADARAIDLIPHAPAKRWPFMANFFDDRCCIISYW
jgi:hypothetical protein